MLNTLKKQLLNEFQHNFPLSPTPFKDIAEQTGVKEEDVLSAFTDLSAESLISRIGPVIKPNCIGVSSLIAMAVPEESLNEVANMINQYPQVNHNYEREHAFNLWFVLIVENQQQLEKLLQELELKTGLKTLQLPLIEDYFIDLGFDLNLDKEKLSSKEAGGI